MGVEEVDRDMTIEVDFEEQAENGQKVFKLHQVSVVKAAGSVGRPGGAVNPAIVERHRQGNILNKPPALSSSNNGKANVVPPIKPLSDPLRPFEQRAHRAALIEFGRLNAMLGFRHPDIIDATGPIKTQAEQLGMKHTQVKGCTSERRSGVDQARTQARQQRSTVRQSPSVANQLIQSRPSEPGPRGDRSFDFGHDTSDLAWQLMSAATSGSDDSVLDCIACRCGRPLLEIFNQFRWSPTIGL